MPKVISANYLDRDSEYKWLVRDADAHPSTVIACKGVNAVNVTFQRSGTYEEGFGCSIVAVAESAEMFGSEVKEMVPLYFDGYDFISPNGMVSRVKYLILDRNGTMLADIS